MKEKNRTQRVVFPTDGAAVDTTKVEIGTLTASVKSELVAVIVKLPPNVSMLRFSYLLFHFT